MVKVCVHRSGGIGGMTKNLGRWKWTFLMQYDPELTRLQGRDGGLTLTLLSYQPRVICDMGQQARADPRNLDRLYELVPILEDQIVFGRARDTGHTPIRVRLPKEFEGNFPIPEKGLSNVAY